MIVKNLIKNINSDLLKQFAEGIGKKWIAEQGVISDVTKQKHAVINVNGVWLCLTTKSEESPKALLEKKGNCSKIEDYSYDELLDNAASIDDVHYHSVLTGTIKTLPCYTLKVRCVDCQGSGVCHHCNGSGKVDCDVCHGSGDCVECGGDGDVNCWICDGDGEVNCDSCYGTGWYITKNGNKVPCRDCEGTGSVECYRCHGRGTFTCRNCGGDGECPQCDGRGDFFCRECNKHDGKCALCDGTGEMNCPKCGGSGVYQMYVGVEIEKIFQNWHYESKAVCDQKISEIKGKVVYNKVWLKFDRTKQFDDTDSLKKSLEGVYPHLWIGESLQIMKFFDDIKNTIDQSAFLPQNKKQHPYTFSVTIEIVDSTKVDYKFGDNVYSFFIIGREYDVVYERTPSLWKRLKRFISKFKK